MREGAEYWDRFCKLQRSSFWLNDKGPAVMQVDDSTGKWNDHYEVSELVDEMQAEINRLKADNKALNERLKIKAL